MFIYAGLIISEKYNRVVLISKREREAK